MVNIVDSIFSKLEKMATGKNYRIFWAVMIMILIILVTAFPKLDASIIFYNRIETRIENMQKLASIDGVSIVDDEALRAEYEDILEDMADARLRAKTGVFLPEDCEFDRNVKFLSGAFLFTILAMIFLFCLRNKNGKITVKFFLTKNLLISALCLLIGFVSGMACVDIPTLWSVWFNVLLAPILQLAFWSLLISAFVGD